MPVTPSYRDQNFALSREMLKYRAENKTLRNALVAIAALDPLTQGDIAVRLAERVLRPKEESK